MNIDNNDVFITTNDFHTWIKNKIIKLLCKTFAILLKKMLK